MSVPGWLNENANRAYPFLAGYVDDGVYALPDDAIVDAGFAAGPDSGFDPGADLVYLTGASRSGDAVTLTFAGTTSPTGFYPLTFVRHRGDPDYTTEHAQSGADDVSLSGDAGDCLVPAWWGFVTTGRTEALFEWLADGESLSGFVPLEPALVQSLAGAYVESVSTANDDRARADAPAGCPPADRPFPTGGVYFDRRCMTGPLRFAAGYNAVVESDPRTNTVSIGARAGAGAGPACGEVPVNPPERAHRGTWIGRGPGPLSGGPWCGDVVRAVNGLGGPDLPVRAGPGAAVVQDPDNHRLVVRVDLADLTTCFSDYERVSESL
jgi:hypothetical protein